MVAAFDRAIDGLRDAGGIIIDLRDNAGGYAPTISGIAGHFFAERTVLGTIRSRAGESKVMTNPRLVTADGRRVSAYAGPVAILTGPRTGSASEVFTSGMQAVGRARVFGEKSYGGALPATTTPLPNGDVFMHAYADFVTAASTRPEGGGVIPDEPAPPSRAGLLAGHDAAFEAAVRWIARQHSASHSPRKED